jgi:hypothetical protein
MYFIGAAVPYYAQQLWKELGVGLGIHCTQAAESFNNSVEKMKELTNRSGNMYEQIFERDYMEKTLPLSVLP